MKNLLFAFTLLHSFGLFGQKHTETIKKDFQFTSTSTDNYFSISNINGNVEVEGYNGTTIKVEVEKTISADSKNNLEQGKNEIDLGFHQTANDIVLYTKSPCTTGNQPSRNEDGKRHWNFYKNNCNWGQNYHFILNFKVKVPRQMNLILSTVNNGKVIVKNVEGVLDINNINGGISLSHISGKTKVNTINGDVDLEYAKNPTKDSRYYSLNGDISVHFKKGLAAQMFFESYNGDFYTNIESLEYLPTPVKKKKKGKGISYKIGSQTAMLVRKGTVKLDFETFNGNVYVKEL